MFHRLFSHCLFFNSRFWGQKKGTIPLFFEKNQHDI